MLKHGLARASAVLMGIVLGLAVCSAQAFEIVIQISPSVLNIGSAGHVVTVHTDLAYGQVYAYSVQLNGVPIESWKADDQGNFVAKFDMDTIKAIDGLVIGGDNELILIGSTTAGEAFVGTDWVRVIDVDPRGR